MFSKKDKNGHGDAENGARNLIGKGTFVRGDVETDGSLRLDGRLEGNIVSKSKVVLGPTAIMIGELKSRHAEISGKIEGNIFAEELVHLKATAQVYGNIISKDTIQDSGAQFKGMHDNTKKADAKQAPALNQKAEPKRAKAV